MPHWSSKDSAARTKIPLLFAGFTRCFAFLRLPSTRATRWARSVRTRVSMPVKYARRPHGNGQIFRICRVEDECIPHEVSGIAVPDDLPSGSPAQCLSAASSEKDPSCRGRDSGPIRALVG